MARTTEPRSLPRLALRLYSAVLCLSLAAAAVNETADSDGSNDSSVADRLAAMVDKQVDIVQVYNKLKLQSELTGEPPVFQGDILLNDRTVEYLRSQTERTAAPGAGQGGVASINGSHPLQAVYRRWKERRTRASVRSEAFKWPNATVIYRFDPNFSLMGRTTAKLAMRHWSKRTCIKFESKKSHHQDFVTFVHHSIGCTSEVGRSGEEQFIFAGHVCSKTLGSMIHELGHAIGFWHEHSRPDRDAYIRILSNNIWPEKLDNFQKLPPTEVDMLGTPYDYDSIMHYGPKAFTRNDRPTLVVRDSSYTRVIGQRNGLSKIDVQQANLLYGCVVPSQNTPSPPQLQSVIKKGDKIALQLASTPGSWMACDGYACNVSSCPGRHFTHKSTQLACSASVFYVHSFTTQGKPLAVGDQLLLRDANQRDVICNKVGQCTLSSECRGADSVFDLTTCGTHVVRLRVPGKQTGEYVQHHDRIILEYAKSNLQWIGCRKSLPPLDGCRRLYYGIDHRNSILSYRYRRDEFVLYKLSQ